MKKIFLSLIVLFSGCNMVEAQTYYYKFTHEVNPKTGVKKTYYGNIYVTFTNNQNICYESDKNGNQLSQFDYSKKMSPAIYVMPMANLSCDHIYKYFSSKNGMYVYALYYSYWSTFPVQKVSEGYYYACFSTDFNKINIDTGVSIIVGERATPPGQASAPTHMY